MKKTYTLAQRPRFEQQHDLLPNPTPIDPTLPLMSILDARKACEIARRNGLDVVVFNVAAQ